MNNIKKHFFSNEKEKVDLTTQIEEAFEAANKIMKEAFLRKNRPDLAEELREVMKSGEGVEAGWRWIFVKHLYKSMDWYLYIWRVLNIN